MRFLHAADLHIDSPLRGLEAYEGAPVERIRSATREAFENLISLAIDESVDFVLLAGDLFDGKWPDIKTGLWTANQFRRLQNHEIPVYLIRGNHDAASEVRKRVRWPENVHEFPVDKPETIIDERLGVAIHGRGFATREVSEDLAAGYPDAVSGLFNIGMLHTSLTGDPDHATYAPTTEDVLVLRGYDYWALGHVHVRRTIREEPRIEFPGNPQGRHIKEIGEKGVLLVSVTATNLDRVEFVPVDVLSWHLAEIELKAEDGLDDLYQQVSVELSDCREKSDGRFSAIRIRIRGACACHSQLIHASAAEEVIAEIRSLASTHSNVWMEKVILETSPPVDIEQLRRGADLMGDLLRSIDQLATGPNEDLLELAETLQPLMAKAPLELGQAGIRLDDPEALRRWVRQSEGILVSRLQSDASDE
jgi:DNA repair protein SbcD/Mre11